MNSNRRPQKQIENRQTNKQIPHDFTIDEYISHLENVLSEKRHARLVQILVIKE